MSLRLRNLLANDRGAAVIEMAIVAPVLALGTIGIIDISNAYSKKLALEQGAQRAIEKIMNTTENATVESTLATEAVCQVNGVNADGTCKTSPITTANVTVTWRLDCTTGATTTTQTTTDSATYDGLVAACAGTRAGYVEVRVTDTYTPMFPVHFASYNSTDHTYHISATAGTRTL
ncbi:MAG TPA: TadE/TadG family type IV pilus assembly protein [Sphingomicrobium sp.]|jgi:Flp pilus assembly protein TadG|nr:TadE/TadG family type IV pilus assembly protein [Sphingomicrobium sp.]